MTPPLTAADGGSSDPALSLRSFTASFNNMAARERPPPWGRKLRRRLQDNLTFFPGPASLAEIRDVIKVPEALLVSAGERARLPRGRQRRGLHGELFVEVADVFLAADRRDKGRRDLLLQQSLPVHVLTEESGVKEESSSLDAQSDVDLL